MWTATIVNVEKNVDSNGNDLGNIRVTVSFTNGVRTEQTFFNVMPVSADDLNNLLKSQCQQQIAYYNANPPIDPTVITGILANPPSGEIDLSAPAPTNAQAYTSARQALIQSKQDLDLGIITQDDYNTALANLKALPTS